MLRFHIFFLIGCLPWIQCLQAGNATSETACDSPTIAVLPVELLSLVFSDYLPICERKYYRLTCKDWNAVILSLPKRNVVAFLLKGLTKQEDLMQRLRVLPELSHLSSLHIDARSDFATYFKRISETLESLPSIAHLSVEVQDGNTGATWAKPSHYKALTQVQALTLTLHKKAYRPSLLAWHNPVQHWTQTDIKAFTHLRRLELIAPGKDRLGPPVLGPMLTHELTKLEHLRLDNSLICMRPYEYAQASEQVTAIEGLNWIVPANHSRLPSFELYFLSRFLSSYPNLKHLRIRLEGTLTQSVFDKLAAIEHVDLSNSFLHAFSWARLDPELCSFKLINAATTPPEYRVFQACLSNFKLLFFVLTHLVVLELYDNRTSCAALVGDLDNFMDDLERPEAYANRVYSKLRVLKICADKLNSQQLQTTLTRFETWFPKLKNLTLKVLVFTNSLEGTTLDRVFEFEKVDHHLRLVQSPETLFD